MDRHPIEPLLEAGDAPGIEAEGPRSAQRSSVPINLKLKLRHAVLVVYTGEEPLMLDNQIAGVVPANSIRHYLPVFSINEDGWWLHRR